MTFESVNPGARAAQPGLGKNAYAGDREYTANGAAEASGSFERIPNCLAHLAAERRWCGWRWEHRNGKPTKPPLRVAGGRAGSYARNDDPATWAQLDDALAAWRNGEVDGVGLQLLNLKESAALDLDKVRDAIGEPLPWARDLIERARSYSEWTPSGEGGRILGTVPIDHAAMHGKWKHPEGGEFEIYAQPDTGRYITVTGDQVPGTPDALADLSGIIAELLALADKQKDGKKSDDSFNALPQWLRDCISHGMSGDRSADFQSAVNALFVRASFEQALAWFHEHPTGPASKYAGRLEAELRRSWDKARDSSKSRGTHERTRPNDSDIADLSHDALALEMERRAGWANDARHVGAWAQWLFWTSSHWQRDDRLEHMTRTRDFLRCKADDLIQWAERKAAEADAEREGDKLRAWAREQAKALRNKHTVAAVESLARSNAGLVAKADDFDADPLLLGTPGGTVDLRTGRLRAAMRGDMVTRQTAIAPAPGAPLRWLQFLEEVFDGDQEIIAFIRRAAGYALTGETREHKLLFFYGTGRNGKSVLLNTLFYIWGTYARRAHAAAFLNSVGDKHPTDIAGLQGARLVVASELPKGKTWDEGTIKDLTGGDVLTARFMRGDFFDFVPQMTLFVSGNNMPSFRGVDEALRARVVLVPFTTYFPPERRDRHLDDTLKAEAPQILQWAIDGALDWQARGLDVPARVAAASAEYFDDEDTIGQFLADETEAIVGSFISAADLHRRFSQWAEQQGLNAWTQRTVVKEVRSRGFENAKSNGRRGLQGLRLR